MSEFKLPPEVTLDRITVVVLKARARYIRGCVMGLDALRELRGIRLDLDRSTTPHSSIYTNPLYYSPAEAIAIAWSDHIERNRCEEVTDNGFTFRPTADGKAMLRAYRAGAEKNVPIDVAVTRLRKELLPK